MKIKFLGGAEQIKLFGEYFKVNAKIESLTNFSAHGDSQQLIRWLNESALKRPRVFVTHGEQHAAEEFCNKLTKTFHWRVEVPKDGAEYDL